MSGTSTPPARATAKAEMTQSGRFPMSRATAVPFATPPLMSARASTRARASSSP